MCAIVADLNRCRRKRHTINFIPIIMLGYLSAASDGPICLVATCFVMTKHGCNRIYRPLTLLLLPLVNKAHDTLGLSQQAALQEATRDLATTVQGRIAATVLLVCSQHRGHIVGACEAQALQALVSALPFP